MNLVRAVKAQLHIADARNGRLEVTLDHDDDQFSFSIYRVICGYCTGSQLLRCHETRIARAYRAGRV